jgi:hypothetical protein
MAAADDYADDQFDRTEARLSLHLRLLNLPSWAGYRRSAHGRNLLTGRNQRPGRAFL